MLRRNNETPFASHAVTGLSRFSIKVVKAGIRPNRIAPGRPQENCSQEQLYLTLKQDTDSSPGYSLLEHMRRFERFRRDYTTERPHEALEQVSPTRRYLPSQRRFD